MKFLSFLDPLRLKKKQEKKIANGDFFVVTKGTYGGDYLMLIKHDETELTFLVLPALEPRIIEKEDFLRGWKNNIVEFIENVPQNVYNGCKKQYEFINNREI
jgi:hypothetical protein